MRRTTAALLILSLLLPSPLVAAPLTERSESTTSAHVAWPWIAKFFGEVALGWLIERGLDYAVNRLWLGEVGNRAVAAITEVSSRPGLSVQDRATLNEAAATYRNVAALLRRTDLTDHEARRRIAALERNIVSRLRDLNQRLGVVEQRLARLEVEQRRQWRVLFDTRSQLRTLQNDVVTLDSRLVALQTDLDARVGILQTDIDATRERVRKVEDVVYPDPARFLRHGLYSSISATYADAIALPGDARLGGGITIQANVSRHIGVYGDLAALPLNATDIQGPEGSSLSWVTLPAVFGVTLNVLPPQSPLSLQFGGGAGLAYSALRYYPPDYDPEQANWQQMKSVSNVIGSAKVEIGAAPPLADAEPVLTVGYLRFIQPLAYAGAGARSDAGRDIWYVSLGLRLRSKLPGERIGASR